MNAIVKYRQALDHLLFLLRHQQVGSLVPAAKRLNCSTRTLKHRIARLRREGHFIVYDRTLKRYVLREEEQG
jgi:DNA-binding transcriptional LysR family regulator